MDRVLKTDAQITITWATNPRKHLKLHLLAATLDLLDNLILESPDEANEDRPSNCDERGDLIRDGISLSLAPDIHARSVVRVVTTYFPL